MALASVAEADIALGHVALWSDITGDAEKVRRLGTGELWLRSSYALPADPDPVTLALMKDAHLVAVRVGLSTPLFPEPSTSDQGALLKLRTKVDSIEEEQQWAAPESSTSGRVSIPEVDAILRLAGIGVELDDHPRLAAFAV